MNSQSPEIRLRAADDCVVEQQPWGRLEWCVSADIGNSDTMTAGRCVIEPGRANGRHLHPNCDELLLVLSGEIVHSWGDREVPMRVGDVISIPSGLAHNARNVGSVPAELWITFSSPHRATQDAS